RRLLRALRFRDGRRGRRDRRAELVHAAVPPMTTPSRQSPAIRASEFDTVLVVDFGAQYAQLIARRVREAHVYSEIVPRTMPLEQMLARRPRGIILSGGPASVHVERAPSIDPALYASGVPVLGICYGAQLLARDLGGEVRATG